MTDEVEMIDVSTALSEKWIDAFEVAAKGKIKLTVSKVISPNTVKGDDGKPIDRFILEFKNAKKALITNRTSAKRLARYVLRSGKRDMNALIGQEVTLVTEEGWRPCDKARGPITYVLPPGN